MTRSDDNHSDTRPISVAELLAKNGTIGAPPVGGRRRRRRGNADAVTVAELTGEIPIIRPTDTDPAAPPAAVDEQAEPADTAVEPTDTAVEPETVEPETVEPETVEPEAVDPEPESQPEPEPEPEVIEDEVADDQALDEVAEDEVAEEVEPAEATDVESVADPDSTDDDYADAVAEYAAHLEHRDADPEPVDFVAPPPRRFGFGRQSATKTDESAAVDAELMSPDPLDEGDKTDLVDSSLDLEVPDDIEDLDDEAALDTDDSEELPSYLRSTQDPLFGGQTVADDLARRGTRPSPEDINLGDEADLDEDLDDEDDTETGEPRQMSTFVHGLWIVGQSVIAVVLGAGLFVAFDQLWKWNNIVALVLSVLVILGLVVGVRVVRKTEDIGSTLIAVAVGALVTLGPLALLQSG
ncbi:MAG: hypothetical protein WBB00_21765 [Mycobacterium sp.]